MFYFKNLQSNFFQCSSVLTLDIDRSLFQIFRYFFLRKVWLLIIVPYVSESKKLSVLSRTFGLGAFGIIMTSSEPQKLVFLLWAQSKVMETIVNDSFLEELLKQHFQSKLITLWRHAIVNEGLWRHQPLKTHFWGLRSRPRHENALKQ